MCLTQKWTGKVVSQLPGGSGRGNQPLPGLAAAAGESMVPNGHCMHSGNSPYPMENLHEEASGQEQQIWIFKCLLNASVIGTLMAKYLKINVHFGIENASSVFLQREGNIFSLDFCSICIFM